MTNRELLKRLQELETAERDVASSMDMPQKNTANWAYAETAAIARSAILQQQEEIAELRRCLDGGVDCAEEKLRMRNALRAIHGSSGPDGLWENKATHGVAAEGLQESTSGEPK